VNTIKAQLLDSFASPRIAPGRAPAGPSDLTRAALESDPRYGRLRDQLAQAGFFERATAEQAVRGTIFFVAIAAAFVLLLRAPGIGVRIGCWAALGFFLVQGCFLAHEAMHGAIAGPRSMQRLVGHLFDTVLVGFSFSYFCRSHELHHFHCNEEATDPDTQSSLFSVFEASARQKAGLGWLFTRLQHALIPIFYPIWALTLSWDGLTYVVRNGRKTRGDQWALGIHLLLWFAVAPFFIGWSAALINYLGRSVFAGLYLATVIPVNHIGRRAIAPDLQLPLLDQQVACTRNLGTSRWMDFFFMGVNCHVEHHLFPWAPTARLGRGRAVLRAFCRAEGLPYHEQRFWPAVRDVMLHFAGMARLVGRPGTSAQAAAARPSAASTRPAS
jgi:fatty acid desaturase